MAQTFGSFLEIAGNVVLGVLHGGKGIFTRYCVRLNPRMSAFPPEADILAILGCPLYSPKQTFDSAAEIARINESLKI